MVVFSFFLLTVLNPLLVLDAQGESANHLFAVGTLCWLSLLLSRWGPHAWRRPFFFAGASAQIGFCAAYQLLQIQEQRPFDTTSLIWSLVLSVFILWNTRPR